MERCTQEVPGLVALEEGHMSACFLAGVDFLPKEAGA